MARRLIVQQFVTANNIAADPDGGTSFMGGYAGPAGTPYDIAFEEDARAFMDSIDTMLLGAKTYRMFADYWPTAKEQGDFADKLNGLDKYVVSRTLEAVPWGDHPAATLVREPLEAVRELKQADGKDIVLWGSFQLMRTLTQAGLVDEYYLRVCPATRATGTPLFDTDLDLRLREAKSYPKGMVTLRYDVSGKDTA